ncbi:hypothetical protein SCHPADRAFT_948036 [Schizopora paradoxa]|uniref:F-box domain-containing protein n=1 Tax=Schizopora paradoxa TaxID=27342 RepID=A0A0H2QYK2_9AGAM|nr:hypothetical protein SCHPADRAFT_948036 [Schizopora paradoxa]
MSHLSAHAIDRLLAHVKLLPTSNWPAVMYSAKILHVGLLEDLFSASGIKFRPCRSLAQQGFENAESGMGVCEIEVSNPSAFDVLKHWRRSAIFQPVRSMFFIVSGTTKEWPQAMHAILGFLASLPCEVKHFVEFHLFVEGPAGDVVLDGSLFVDLIRALMQTKCNLFSLYTGDLSFGMDTEQLTMDITTSPIVSPLRSITIESSILLEPTFHRSLLTWFAAASRSLKSLDICFGQPLSASWTTFIRQLHFPNLYHIRVEPLDQTCLAEILQNHPNIVTLELSNLDSLSTFRVPAIRLPSLGLVIGRALDVDRFLRSVTELHALHISLELQVGADVIQGKTFDTNAHLLLLQSLALRPEIADSLTITFPDLDSFTQSFFPTPYSRSRPENSLRISSIQIVLQVECGLKERSVKELLDMILTWLPLFPCLEHVWIMRHSGEVGDHDKGSFTSAVFRAMPHVIVRF